MRQAISSTFHFLVMKKRLPYSPNLPGKTSKALPGWPIGDRPALDITPEEVWNCIRKQIKWRMRELGYTSIESFALEAGISKGGLIWLLSGKREPQLSSLWRIVRALGWNDLPSIWDVPEPLPETWDDL